MSLHRPLRVARLSLAALLLTAGLGTALAQTMQEHVHGHGHEVMPFDLSRTLHVFRMTDDGGVQQVITRGDAPQPDQVHMIQHHLQMEAASFQQGNFSDPAHLHGADMPGLRELQAGAAKLQVRYSALPNGAQIELRSDERPLVTAIHRWFGAQLSEHGADARAE